MTYLSKEAIDWALQVIRLLPRRSEIVFEYMIPLEMLPSSEQEEIEADEIRKKAMGINEPILTRFVPAELTARLRRKGFSEVTDFSHEDGQERYFRVRHDGLAADPAYHLMRATV